MLNRIGSSQRIFALDNPRAELQSAIGTVFGKIPTTMRTLGISRSCLIPPILPVAKGQPVEKRNQQEATGAIFGKIKKNQPLTGPDYKGRIIDSFL